MCSEVVENSLTLPCRHRFCRQCVTAYLESKINDGIIDITCPDLAPAPAEGQDGAADVGCPELLDEALICEMISAEALHKYERRKAQNADPNLRECPGAPGAGGCGELVQVRKGKFGRGIRHDMTCGKCGHTFCASCLAPWLTRAQTCPVCRAPACCLSVQEVSWPRK